MYEKKLLKAGILTLVLVVSFIVGWEWYWNNKGYTATYNDDKALWTNKRREAYHDKATVFIGSSRIKFDLDIPTWEATTNEKAVQLSLVGTSPRLLLEDLANDENFSGKLVVDITEVLFFSKNPAFHQSAKEAIGFYQRQTLSERLSSEISFALEANLAFLEERRFSLNTLLNDLEIPNRAGVFVVPPFPKGFEWTNFDRQTYMSEMFLSDSNDLKRQTDIWSKLIMGDPTPAVDGEELMQIFKEIKTNVDRIKSRGGKVIFVRTPSSGPMAEGEEKKYPKAKYWDKLIAFTQCEGLHYLDDPATKNLICPEWSHLSPKDAVFYTQQLAQSLRQKGWFPVDHSRVLL